MNRIDYLMARLRAGRGHQAVLIAELVKAHNARPARRATDARICGWSYVQLPLTQPPARGIV